MLESLRCFSFQLHLHRDLHHIKPCFQDPSSPCATPLPCRGRPGRVRGPLEKHQLNLLDLICTGECVSPPRRAVKPLVVTPTVLQPGFGSGLQHSNIFQQSRLSPFSSRLLCQAGSLHLSETKSFNLCLVGPSAPCGPCCPCT